MFGGVLDGIVSSRGPTPRILARGRLARLVLMGRNRSCHCGDSYRRLLRPSLPMTTLRTTPHQTGRQAARQTGRATGEETGQVRISSPAVEALELPPIGLKRVFSYLIACLVVVALGAVLVAKYATPPRSTAAPSSFVAAPNVAANEDATPTETDPVRALRGAIGPASQVTISPAGDRLLAVRDRGVDVWRVDGSHTGWLAVDGDRVSGAAWSADGSRVVVWGPEGTVRLWNAEK